MSSDLGLTSARRLFAVCAAVSLIPVVLLAALLFQTARRQGEAQGLERARDQADLFASAVVAPSLDGHLLDEGLGPSERLAVERSVQAAVSNGSALRVRLRGVKGLVTYASDGSGHGLKPDHEALDAGRGTGRGGADHLRR